MSFPRYPAYKDSGVEWLGTVPEHWRVDRLKRNLSLLTEKSDSKTKPVALETSKAGLDALLHLKLSSRATALGSISATSSLESFDHI